VIDGLPTRFAGTDMLISTATAGQVDLIVNSGGFGLQFWDGASTVGNGLVEGGTSTWNNATSNWTTADGAVNAPWQGGFAVLQGAAGTVTLGEPIALEGMQFRTTGYVIGSGGFGLAAAPRRDHPRRPLGNGDDQRADRRRRGRRVTAYQGRRRGARAWRNQQLHRRHHRRRRHAAGRRGRQPRRGDRRAGRSTQARWALRPVSPLRATSRSSAMAARFRPSAGPS
jgi:hypothetical protein